jgi:hypothetical protein
MPSEKRKNDFLMVCAVNRCLLSCERVCGQIEPGLDISNQRQRKNDLSGFKTFGVFFDHISGDRRMA